MFLRWLKRLLGIGVRPDEGGFAVSYKLEELSRQHANVEFGIEPVEIPDQNMLAEFLAYKRGGSRLWRPVLKNPDNLSNKQQDN